MMLRGQRGAKLEALLGAGRFYVDFFGRGVVVVVCIVLCNFITCTDSCNDHQSRDTELPGPQKNLSRVAQR